MSFMAVFIQYPWLAAAVGALFLVQGRSARRGGAIVVGGLWLLYAAYETGMKQRWLCTGECNIRVDLLLIYPLLLIGSLIAGLGLFRSARDPARRR
jgi:hypothetical protein